MNQKSLVILCDGNVRYFRLTFVSATTLKDVNGSNVIYFYYEGSQFLTHCITVVIESDISVSNLK